MATTKIADRRPLKAPQISQIFIGGSTAHGVLVRVGFRLGGSIKMGEARSSSVLLQCLGSQRATKSSQTTSKWCQWVRVNPRALTRLWWLESGVRLCIFATIKWCDDIAAIEQAGMIWELQAANQSAIYLMEFHWTELLARNCICARACGDLNAVSQFSC